MGEEVVVVVVGCFPLLGPSTLLAEEAAGWRVLMCCETMRRSYSLPARRRNSSMITRSMTPMHDPAKAPWVLIRHERAMKPGVMLVGQFC
jgi:hypothetical protein